MRTSSQRRRTHADPAPLVRPDVCVLYSSLVSRSRKAGRCPGERASQALPATHGTTRAKRKRAAVRRGTCAPCHHVAQAGVVRLRAGSQEALEILCDALRRLSSASSATGLKLRLAILAARRRFSSSRDTGSSSPSSSVSPPAAGSFEDAVPPLRPLRPPLLCERPLS
eukprot:CAMPEP_0115866848 /NCGR_PEP_ID=MMETSP0287-20121206/20463_1 /TAXON_ID=412157 /ORGANISM="Chrysochromulina rotalis, Strain UIO044" /LENGTH=167 /DNA_ID=CAMNT_0003321433 /DNA_START=286 /DNA_END=787 /DNA_ORIENTATION=+